MASVYALLCEFPGAQQIAAAHLAHLKTVLLHLGKDGSVSIENAVKYFRDFYASRRAQGLPAEKKRCIYLRDDVTDKQIIANLINNPVKALCESGFFFFNEQDQTFSLSPVIWAVLDKGSKAMLTRICRQRLKEYYSD